LGGRFKKAKTLWVRGRDVKIVLWIERNIDMATFEQILSGLNNVKFKYTLSDNYGIYFHIK
jgi:hypothetical protein